LRVIKPVPPDSLSAGFHGALHKTIGGLGCGFRGQADGYAIGPIHDHFTVFGGNFTRLIIDRTRHNSSSSPVQHFMVDYDPKPGSASGPIASTSFRNSTV
jgi:hypothetical protein